MSSFRRQILLKAFELFDLLILAFAFVLAASIVSYQMTNVSVGDFLAMRIKVQNFLLLLGFFLVWHMIFSSFGLYHSRRLSSRWHETFAVIKATVLGSLFIIIMAVLFHIDMVTLNFITVFWVTSTAVSILSRLTLRYALEQIRIRGRNLRYMLIVGTNQRAINFARKIESKKELGYRIIGFVDDKWSGIDEFKKNGYELVANFKNFPAFLRDNVVDEAVISLPVSSKYKQASRIVALCEEQGIIVRCLSDIFNSKLAHSETGHFEGEPLVSLHTGGMEGWQVLAKRALDIVLSLVLLLLLLPLFLVTAFLIMITSPGPVFFIQERVGLNKRRFLLYKFRTMIKDAELKQAELESLNEVEGPVFKIRNDPRITPLGKFLRKTSIDELSQLINVLKGDMSLVGPRPLPVRDYNGFDKDWHRRRFSVRPGITCLWQVDGRSDIPFEKWMELDMEYIDNWTLWLDIRILAKTITAVTRGSGAS
jgi:exopolysaccharide biosynthesis polyprenyl glycosylphosphotransferase